MAAVTLLAASEAEGKERFRVLPKKAVDEAIWLYYF